MEPSETLRSCRYLEIVSDSLAVIYDDLVQNCGVSGDVISGMTVEDIGLDVSRSNRR